MFENMNEQQAREQLLNITASYCDTFLNQEKPFVEGQRIPYASRVYDKAEIVNLVDSSLEFWLTAGRFTEQFESLFPKFIGSKYCSLVNSGSSANLLALAALTSPLLGENSLKPGDEVITVAAAFPTTVAPIIQCGAIPVFVDITIPQYNIDATQLEAALSEKSKAVFLAHTLGNPFNLQAVFSFCKKHNLWLIEDNCDALGAKYIIDGKERFTGTIGDIGTSSFYPAHHMTMGEGGAVYTDNPILHKIVRSMRDWGRDCVCPGGHDNACGHRFDKQYGELPMGYDHKYVYSHFGYNLKVTDLQASIGVAQLQKLPMFIKKRREHFDILKNGLRNAGAEKTLILPEEEENASASWFGFPITCKDKNARSMITQELENSGVQTRNLFAGNIIRHPCFDEMRKAETGYRIVGELGQTDFSMYNTFWVGVYPGLTDKQLDYMVKQITRAALV